MKHRVSKRPPQIEIKAAIIQVRTLTYMRTTHHSIRTAEDVLWSFPEKYNAPRNNPAGKWEWSEVKRQISCYIMDYLSKEWVQTSSGRPGTPKKWSRIPETPAAVLEEVRA